MNRLGPTATLLILLTACTGTGVPAGPGASPTDGGGREQGPAAPSPHTPADADSDQRDGLPGLQGSPSPAPGPIHDTATDPALPFTLHYDERDADQAQRVADHLEAAGETLQRFFGFTSDAPVAVTLHPDRAAFDASFPPEWGLDQTACWMVATGVAGRLDLLSPRVWARQACEHDPTDDQHLALLLTHELAHVLHGQRNPTGDFTGAEEVGWFAEGLATLASGQLDGPHAGKDRQALEAGAGPTDLASAWSGPWRYGVCGSLVRHIDRRLGRPGLVLLLAATDNATILAALGTDEPSLLADWRAEVLAGT